MFVNLFRSQIFRSQQHVYLKDPDIAKFSTYLLKSALTLVNRNVIKR